MIDRPNLVWCAIITYIPMRRGFLYLAAIMDLCSRKLLALRLSNSMYADFCIEALKEALEKHGKPEIFNTDQGSHFTSGGLIDVLTDAKISMPLGDFANHLPVIGGKGARRPSHRLQATTAGQWTITRLSGSGGR